ncbi:MAG: methyltransferase family protein [Promethearchaeota archaeon]
MVENEILTNKINIYEKPKKKIDQLKFSWKDFIPSMIYGPLILAQIFLIFFYYNHCNLDFLTWIGWGFIIFFLLFGSLPRQAFKKYGEIEKRKSHINTTKLVDKGIYSIIRHPYWFSWIILSISLTLMSQHWIMFLLGIPAWIVIYLETFMLDKGLIMKFGDDYIKYREKVPRINLILGLIKYCTRKKRED